MQVKFSNEELTAYNEGFAAAQDNYLFGDIEENPYRAGTALAYAWNKGSKAFWDTEEITLMPLLLVLRALNSAALYWTGEPMALEPELFVVRMEE